MRLRSFAAPQPENDLDRARRIGGGTNLHRRNGEGIGFLCARSHQFVLGDLLGDFVWMSASVAEGRSKFKLSHAGESGSQFGDGLQLAEFADDFPNGDQAASNSGDFRRVENNEFLVHGFAEVASIELEPSADFVDFDAESFAASFVREFAVLNCGKSKLFIKFGRNGFDSSNQSFEALRSGTS